MKKDRFVIVRGSCRGCEYLRASSYRLDEAVADPGSGLTVRVYRREEGLIPVRAPADPV